MSIFQIYIYKDELNVIASNAYGDPFLFRYTKNNIQIPFLNSKRVKLLTVELVHHNAVNGPLQVLCRILSGQIYNNIAGSRDIIVGSGITNFQNFYLYNIFQNNQNMDLAIENINGLNLTDHQDDFEYLIVTLEIES